MVSREARCDSQRGVPAVGDFRQRRVERFAQASNDLRQRIGEVAVLATPDAVARHDDAAAEQREVPAAVGEGLAVPSTEAARPDRQALTLECCRAILLRHGHRPPAYPPQTSSWRAQVW